MACPNEKKMLQMILLQYEICTGVIRTLFESYISQTYPGKNFAGFLNEPDIKHVMFHFFHNKTRCCKCPALDVLEFYPHLLTEAQFKDIFNLGILLHIKTSNTGRIIQNCLCNFTAKPGATIDKFDTTLMIGMFQHCWIANNQSIFEKLKDIREIRNKLVHASSLREFSEDDLDQMFLDAENAVLEIAKHISFPSYAKSVKRKIDILRLAVIRQDDVKNGIAEMKFIAKKEKKGIVQLLSKKIDLVDKSEMKQMWTRLDNIEKNLAKDFKKNKDVTKNQDEIMMKTQDQHKVQLDTFQGISEDVYKTTFETKMEQSQQSIAIDVIQNSVEKLGTMALDEEEKDSLRKLKTKLNSFPCLAGTYIEILLECDGHQIHLLTNTKTIRATQAAEIDSYKQFKELPAFTVMCILQETFLNKSIFTQKLKKIFEWSIFENQYIVCKYILETFDSIGEDIQFLRTSFYQAISKNSTNSAKALAWHVVKLFVGTFSASLKLCIDVWPGIRCKCKKGSGYEVKDQNVFCSSEMVIVIEHVGNNVNLPVNFCGHEIIKITKSECFQSQEGIRISEKLNYVDIRTEGINSLSAEQLFKIHSKLCVISPSAIKSTGFPSNQEFKLKNCVQLFCKIKGIIPTGEPHFPVYIGELQTDVLSGSSYFLTKFLKIGDEVVSETSTGTLGGFIKILGDDTFLTCAHVVLNKDALLSTPERREIMSKVIKIGIQDNNMSSPLICGKLRNIKFREGNSKETSIDAALVTFEEGSACINPAHILCDNTGLPKSGNDIGMTDVYINHGNFVDGQIIGSYHALETLAVGSVSGYQIGRDHIQFEDENDIATETLIQVYDTMRQPRASWVDENVHLTAEILQLGEIFSRIRRNCKFYNQISFRNISFAPGDSGTCIYVKDQNNATKAIGMALANHPNGGCVATPMKDILAAFDLL